MTQRLRVEDAFGRLRLLDEDGVRELRTVLELSTPDDLLRADGSIAAPAWEALRTALHAHESLRIAIKAFRRIE